MAFKSSIHQARISLPDCVEILHAGAEWVSGCREIAKIIHFRSNSRWRTAPKLNIDLNGSNSVGLSDCVAIRYVDAIITTLWRLQKCCISGSVRYEPRRPNRSP